MNSEMKSRGWLWSAIGLQLCTGYTVAFLVNQFGTLFTTGSFAPGFIPGLAAIALMVLAVVLISGKIRARFDREYSLHRGAKATSS